jgi:dTDP-4-amino-4,6-dideoxy-D-galactose acyltransferase
MQNNIIKTLKWDSEFFGYPVAKIYLDQNGIDDLDCIFKQLESERFRVTYFFVPPEEKEIINHILRKGSVLVDQKTTFSKTTEKHNNFSNNIVEFQEEEINEKLVQVVLEAGIYSRFRTDGNFKNNEYERLYIEWFANSVKKKIAIKTFLAKKGSEVIGITTLGKKEHHADIGLVAVCENFRGQGIGYDLTHSADNAAFEMGLNEIKVVTQLKNKSACHLYEKCNFQIENITNIYHFWQ